ncbi:MAG: hypothetical protein ACOYN4_15650 [Bacteroidales bacterium]
MAFIRNIEKKEDGLTYGEILDRYAKLQNITGLKGDKLCFARSKNLIKLRAFEKVNNPTARIPLTKDFEDYQKKYSDIRGKFLLTDKESKSVLQDGNPMVDIANPELTTKLAELKETFKAAIQEREDNIKAYNEFMLELVPEDELPKTHTVKMEDVSGLTQEQVDAVIWFVQE